MQSQVVDRITAKWSGPDAYSVCQSMFIAMLELRRLMSGELFQELVTIVLDFPLSTCLVKYISHAILFPLLSLVALVSSP